MIGTLIVLFLELILCIVLVFKEIDAHNFIHLLMLVSYGALNSKDFQFITEYI